MTPVSERGSGATLGRGLSGQVFPQAPMPLVSRHPEDKCFEIHSRRGPAVPRLFQDLGPDEKASHSELRMRHKRGEA